MSSYNALKINPRDDEPWYNKGVALKNLGIYEEAIECFERFIELASPQYASLVEQVKEIINQLRKKI